MKLAGFALLLMASMAFVFTGCSDNPTQPISLTDQSAQAPASLGKVFTTPFECYLYPIPPYVLDPGVANEEGQKRIVHGFRMQERWQSTSDLMDGTYTNEVNGVQDKVTGEGETNGRVVITPFKDVGGGVWEGEYHGKIVKSETPGIWTCAFSGVGHGRGGTIHGMKYTLQGTITVYGLPITGWVATATGEIQTH
jgi:hypothetical protein